MVKMIMELVQNRSLPLPPVTASKAGYVITGERSRGGQWPKEIIKETYLYPDVVMRSACIQTRRSLIERDIQKLCLLEGSN